MLAQDLSSEHPSMADIVPERELIKTPSLLLLMLESRVFAEFAAMTLSHSWLKGAPVGDGHAVMVIPGFLASDLSTKPLRKYLRKLGYKAYGWDRGYNLGQPGDPAHQVNKDPEGVERLEEIQMKHGGKISLIGWSLGGIYARELARQAPHLVRQVITMGSPFNGNLKATHVSRVYEFLRQVDLDEMDPDFRELIRTPPPVPTSAIYSKTDGVVAWQNCRQDEESELSENIEVVCSHIGFGFNPLVHWILAERLAQTEGEWQKMDRSIIPELAGKFGLA